MTATAKAATSWRRTLRSVLGFEPRSKWAFGNLGLFTRPADSGQGDAVFPACPGPGSGLDPGIGRSCPTERGAIRCRSCTGHAPAVRRTRTRRSVPFPGPGFLGCGRQACSAQGLGGVCTEIPGGTCLPEERGAVSLRPRGLRGRGPRLPEAGSRAAGGSGWLGPTWRGPSCERDGSMRPAASARRYWRAIPATPQRERSSVRWGADSSALPEGQVAVEDQLVPPRQCRTGLLV